MKVAASKSGLWLAVGLALLGGCSQPDRLPPNSRPQPVASMFNPAAMRLHPTFTRVKNWTSTGAAVGTGPADGVEAELEFTDKFNDTVKAEGRVIFELYEYRKDAADVRGRRVTTPFVGSLLTEQEQRARWNTTTRTYSFRLLYPGLDANRAHVLTATFEPRAGGRFFGRIILQPSPVVGP